VIDPAALCARKGDRGPRGMHYLPHKNRGLDTEDGGLTKR